MSDKVSIDPRKVRDIFEEGNRALQVDYTSPRGFKYTGVLVGVEDDYIVVQIYNEILDVLMPIHVETYYDCKFYYWW